MNQEKLRIDTKTPKLGGIDGVQYQARQNMLVGRY